MQDSTTSFVLFIFENASGFDYPPDLRLYQICILLGGGDWTLTSRGDVISRGGGQESNQ